MRSINDYGEYLAVLKDKSSKDPSVCNEANRALEKLQLEDPGRYTLYRTMNGEIKPPEEVAPLTPKKKRNVYDKEQYIREHPEINIEELRKKAFDRLLRNRYGIDLCFYIPHWVSKEEVLKSLDFMTISDLITASGKEVPRETLIRRCIQRAVMDGRIDEKRLREIITSQFISHYKKNNITLRSPNLYEPIKRMINNDATVEELVNVTSITSLDCEKMVRLINSKEIKVTEKDKNKQSRNARKRAKRRADKEAALKKAREKEGLMTKQNNPVTQNNQE